MAYQAQDHAESSAARMPQAIGVFWDIENCAVPHGKSALALVQRIRDRLFTGHREVEFMCVCDTSKEHRDVIQELNYAQVTVVHIHATSKNAADDKLRQSLRRFANAYPPQSTAVLLSGDVNFTSELSDLRYRHHHRVVLVHPMYAQDALLNCAHTCYSYEELTRDLPEKSRDKTMKGSTELLVSGLPRNRPIKVLQQRLRLLSDNCGGRVINVSRSSALLNFPNVPAASRAQKRLNNEEVYGSRIVVDFAYCERPQHRKGQENNIGYYSPKVTGGRPRNRTVQGLQRSHSLSPEPGSHGDDQSTGFHRGISDNSSQQHGPKISREATRSSQMRTQVYYGKGYGSDEAEYLSAVTGPRFQSQEIPERDCPTIKAISCQTNPEIDSEKKILSSMVDASTMTNLVSAHRRSPNKAKKKQKPSKNELQEQKHQADISHPNPTVDKSKANQRNKTVENLPKSPGKFLPPEKVASKGSKANVNENQTQISSTEIDHGRVIISSRQRKKRGRSQNRNRTQSLCSNEDEMSANKSLKCDKNRHGSATKCKQDLCRKQDNKSPAIKSQVFVSNSTIHETISVSNQVQEVQFEVMLENQTNSDVIVEDESFEEISIINSPISSKSTISVASQLPVPGSSNYIPESHSQVVDSAIIQCSLPGMLTGTTFDMRPHSAGADLIVYRSRSPAHVHPGSNWKHGRRTRRKPRQDASPHHLTRPCPIRPKPSPIKYPGSYDNTYYSNSYQYCTPPSGGKFNYYYHRNSYRSSGGYYSHFGSPGNFGSPVHSPGDPDNGPVRDMMDNFTRKKKMSREVMFLQQQIYQEDQVWPKGEGEEDYELTEGVDGYCRDECHSAPPLPYHRGYHYMTPEKSPYSSRSPHFRRTPGAHRPPTRTPRYSGDRPGSSMSDRSNSSNGSYGNLGYSEPGQFRPIRFGSPRHMAHEYGESTEEADCKGDMTELMVSNLDYNISAREWRKILYAEFHQHVQVLDVHILTQPDNTNIGYIKVPTMEEARFAISQFHRKKIGYKRIHVTIVNQDEDSIANAKTDVVTLLKEVPNHQLSLYKLMELYEKRFHHPITASELYSFQDVLEIVEFEGPGRIVRLHSVDGSTTEQEADISTDVLEDIVCTVHCPDGSATYQEVMEATSVPFVTQQLRGFAAQLHTLLQGHAGYLPLLSFPICYRAEFGSLNIVPHGGVPLEHLVSCVPGVRIDISKSGAKRIQWAENKVPPALDQTRFCNSPLLNQQLAQFSREVIELLKHTPQCRMPFNKFIPMYHHTLGRQCRVADYGYTKLIELLDAIPHIVQVIGSGARKYVTLTHRAQMKRFALDILRVLKSQASKQISVLDLAIVYNKVLARPFDITEYGLCYLEDVLQELPENAITVTGTCEEMVLCIPRRDSTDMFADQTQEEVERTKQFALEVIDLLKHSPQCRMPFNRFIPAYHHHFGKQCRVSDYGFTKLIELFEAIPHVLKLIASPDQSYSTKIIDEQEDKILMLVEPEMLKVLEEQVMALLKNHADHKLPVPEFLSSFTKFHGHSLRLQDYGVTSVVELIEKIKRIAQVESQEGKYIIKLMDHTHLQVLARRILLLLMEQVDGSMVIDVIQERYKQLFGYTLSEDELEHDLEGIIQVTTTGTKKSVKLCPLQMFARDARTLLRQHHGKLPLSQFDTEYANHFGVHLVSASYGYPRIMTLLQAIPHVIQLRGKGFNVTVLLCQDFQGKLFAGSPASVERAMTPLPTKCFPTDTQPHVSVDQSTSDDHESEPELMSLKSARNSPNDLLSVRVPSGVPSPDLNPSAVLTPGDLMKFDSGGAVGVHELFAGLSTEEKQGQKTPLCKTPVSEMLQFAAQLLPVSPQPPVSGQSLHYMAHYPHYNPSYHGHYMYNVPPVPSNAQHVAALEQQINNVSYPGTRNYAGQPANQDKYSVAAVHSEINISQPVLAANSSGTLSFESNLDPGLSPVGGNEIQKSSESVDASPAGGTLFWMKNEDSGGVPTKSRAAGSEDATRVMPAGCDSPAKPAVMADTAASDVTSPLSSASTGLNLDEVSMPSRPVESQPMGESPEMSSRPNTSPGKTQMNQSASSESFHSLCDSPPFTLPDRLGKITLTSPNKELDDLKVKQKNGDKPLLWDTDALDQRPILKVSGSSTEEDPDGSSSSTPSPSRKLGGTPRKSRIAAKFTTNSVM